MSLHRHAARRDVNEHELVNLLRQLGASWQPLSATGAPDGMIGWQGQTFLAEIKRPGKSLRDTQEEWAETWNGSPVYLLRTPEDVFRLLKVKAWHKDVELALLVAFIVLVVLAVMLFR